MRKNTTAHRVLRRMTGCALGVLVACALLLSGCGGDPVTESSAPGDETVDTTSTTSAGEVTTTQAQKADTTTQTAVSTTVATQSKPVTQKPTTTAATTTKSAGSALSKRKTSNIGFGYYGLSPDRLELDISGNTIIQGDYVNTIIADAHPYTLNFCKANNTRVWCSVHTLYDMVAKGYKGWETEFDKLVANARDSGAYDALLGWYLDEPVDQEAVKTLSQYAKKYGKRFFVCYTVSTVAPQIYSDGIRQPVTADQAQYLTDIAFDMYWGDRARFEAVLASMKQRVARDDVYIWFIPGCYGNKSLASSASAAAAELDGWVDQLYMLYDMLKVEKKPGGLMCFAYNFNPDSTVEDLYGLKQINEGTGGAWNELLAEQIKVGREICTGKMK